MSRRDDLLSALTGTVHLGKADAEKELTDHETATATATLRQLLERLEADLASSGSQSDDFKHGLKAAITEIKLSIGDKRPSPRPASGGVHVTQVIDTVEAGSVTIGYQADRIG